MHHLIVQQKAYTFYSSFSVEMQHGSDTCTEFGRVTNEQKVAKKKKKEYSGEEKNQTSERMQMHTCL